VLTNDGKIAKMDKFLGQSIQNCWQSPVDTKKYADPLFWPQGISRERGRATFRTVLMLDESLKIHTQCSEQKRRERRKEQSGASFKLSQVESAV